MGSRKQQCLVNLYDDGTCVITCDGSEIGQGLHIKMQQYAAYYLSQIVPGSIVAMKKIRVGPIGTDKVSHGSITGGSTTSERVCEAVRNAIENLAENLRPVKEAMQADESAGELTFEKLLAKAGGVELQASGRSPTTVDYNIYGACCSEVEVDVLTSETVIRSSSMLYDCGKSLNPTIDLGQCEGGFMMGVGFFLRERLLQDPSTKKLATDGTWSTRFLASRMCRCSSMSSSSLEHSSAASPLPKPPASLLSCSRPRFSAQSKRRSALATRSSGKGLDTFVSTPLLLQRTSREDEALDCFQGHSSRRMASSEFMSLA